MHSQKSHIGRLTIPRRLASLEPTRYSGDAPHGVPMGGLAGAAQGTVRATASTRVSGISNPRSTKSSTGLAQETSAEKGVGLLFLWQLTCGPISDYRGPRDLPKAEQ